MEYTVLEWDDTVNAINQGREVEMPSRITHSVFFRLKHSSGSEEERKFLETCVSELADVPGVSGFRVVRQTSTKNDFDFGLTMEFATQEAYEGYNRYPAHVAFVKNIWIPEVKGFLEIDYIETE